MMFVVAVIKLLAGTFRTVLDWLLFFRWVEMLVLISGVDPLFLVLNFFTFLGWRSSVLANFKVAISQTLLIILIACFPSIINQQHFIKTSLFHFRFFYNSIKLARMLPFLSLLWSLQLAIAQVVFLEDFETYNTGVNKLVYLPFAGSWYRSDVDKFTGVFKVKGPNAVIASKYLGVFSQGASSVTCVEVSMAVGSLYQLSFDHTWQTFNTSILFVRWNNATIFNFSAYGLEGVFIRQVQELPLILSPVNQLCFCGYNSFSGIRIGLAVDNIEIALLRTPVINTTNSSNSPNDSTTNISDFSSANSSANLTNISTTNQTENWANNPSQTISPKAPQNKVDNQGEYMRFQWVIEFVERFNYFLKFTSFVGFPYLISNLLNFWNIIVLYYFLPLKSYLGLYKIELEQLCRISLQEGSLLSLVEKSLNNRQISLPNIECQKIPPTSTDWPSFSQLGFTSQILINNVQFYFGFLNCIFKLAFLRFLSALVKKFKCLTSLLQTKTKYLDIFCYQIVSSSPGMFIPLAIMLSMNSSSGYSSLSQKINNMCQFLVIMVVGICICVPILMKKRVILRRPQKKCVKSTIMVESQHEGSTPSINIRTTKMTQKVSNEIQFQKASIQYHKQVRNQKFIHQIYVADTYNHLLFFTIPFLIGLQCLWLFFLTNFAVLVYLCVNLFRKGELIRQFNLRQFYFRICIKLVFITIHILFIVLYCVDKEVFELPISQIALINFLTIIMIIFGAIIETIHTCVNFLTWSWEMWQKFGPKSNKISSLPQNLEEDQKKKTIIINTEYHMRKISACKLNQIESINEPEDENQKKTVEQQEPVAKKVTKITGIKTERISKIVFDIKEEQVQ